MDKKQKNLWNNLISEYEYFNVSSTIELGINYIKLYPKDGAAWLMLGTMYTSISQYDKALISLRKAAKFFQQNRLDMVYCQYGDLYRTKGSLKIAEKWYRKAININPKSTENNIFLGGLLAQMGRLAEAKKYHVKATKLKKDSWDEAHFNLGLLYRADRKYKIALKHFDKAIEIDPKYYDAIEERKDVLNAIKIKNNL